MFARLIVTLFLLFVVGGAGYYFGYRAGSGGRNPTFAPGEILGDEVGTVGSRAGEHAREAGRGIGDTLADAGNRATAFVSDASLTTKIKSKMGLDDIVDATDIGVSTSSGVVTLTGRVASEDERKRAVQLARETRGVKSVTDKLEIAR